jgi:SAM-dependent methyltransferase
MSDKLSTPSQLLEMVNSFRKSRILLTAHELNLFSILGFGSMSSTDVALTAGTNPRATDRLMNALVAMGLMEKKDSFFLNTTFAQTHLVKASPDFMGGLTHQVHLWKTWSTLTEAVIKGSSVTIRDSFEKRDDAWLNAFLSAMHSRSQQAKEVAELIDLSGVKKMLDVGGGSGAFTYAFIRRNKNIVSTLFDLPKVVAITEKYIAMEGFTDSVKTLEGDYRKESWGTGFDLVLVSAVVHINSFEENQHLIKKCAGSLNSGGQLIIMDHIMNESRTEPEIGAIFAINMLVGTENGDTYTESEIRSWMADAGLTNIQFRQTPTGTSVLVGFKEG